MREQGQNKKAAVQSLRCQLDKYNVSPIKNSFPFFNSAEALLTAAWQGGCQRVRGLYDQHRNNGGPYFFPHPFKTFWHVNKTFFGQHFSNGKMTIYVFDFHLFFSLFLSPPGKTKNSIVSEFYSKKPFLGLSSEAFSW